VAPRTLLHLALLACLLAAGCREGKLTLRGAEDLSQAWLQNLGGFLNPSAQPSPHPREVSNAETPEGAVTAGEAENEEDAEQPAPSKPRCLRDCFVDDGWSPEGFKNPTEAIAWLTATPRTLGRVLSIDLVEGGAEITFELKGNPPAVLTAFVVREGSLPKCKRLQQAQTAQETNPEAKDAENKAPASKPATSPKAPSTPAKTSKATTTAKRPATGTR
jgi:hypothetical protein